MTEFKRYRRLRHGEKIGRDWVFMGAKSHGVGYLALRWKLPGSPAQYVWIQEHRHIMGDPPGKHVHHKNGIRSDNRIENLEVMDPGEHTRLHHQRLDGPAMAAQYRSGDSLRVIARRYNTDHATVLLNLRKMGVTMRTISEARRLGVRIGKTVAEDRVEEDCE